MKQGFFETLPIFPATVYSIQEKTGSRVEYSLELSDSIKTVASSISDVPLKFASLVLAYPQENSNDQDFHSDSESGERAIIYLTDVIDDANGPIEFKKYGKILGKAGTFVHYSANEVHRGCKSDIHRYALALAFDKTEREITTIGGPTTNCIDYTCPVGYKLKNPAPTNIDLTYQNCCNQTDNTIVIILFVLLGLFILSAFILRKRIL
jgi:hypothetical protein